MTTELVLGGTLQIRDEEKRLVECLIVPWDVETQTARGVESFERGAFDDLPANAFVFRQRHQDPPTGRSVEHESREDAQYGVFHVSPTAAGDEQLQLIRDGVEAGVSVGFEDGQFDRTKGPDGRMHYRHKKVNPAGQLEVSTTWRPAYKEAAVIQLRESEVTEDQEQPAAQAMEAPAPVATTDSDGLMQLRADTKQLGEALFTRLEKLDEKQRAFAVAAMTPVVDSAKMQRHLKIQVRELAEVITTGNEGVVPDAVSSEILGRVDESRPFLNTTRRVPTPSSGLNLVFPKITQTPLVATQAAEKDEVASRATAITTVDFPMLTKAGAGDLSIQLIKRSSPEFLNLWIELLADAYALDSENGAVDALLAETAVVEGTGTFDVETDSFGEAFLNTTTASGRSLKPNRIWMSTTALIQFMNARSPSGGGGTPLYPSLSAIGGFSEGGNNPLGFQLQPVWVPALDDEAVDIIIGPSGGFVWAEDGTYTLQADVPSKAGRDVGIVGMIFYAPIYPAAFTTYVVAT